MSGAGYSLSDADIRRAAKTKVWLYSDLLKKKSLQGLFDSKGRCALLYETTSPTSGHWVAMIRRGGSLEYFDPYGGIPPDGELRWLGAAQAAALGENTRWLSQLLKASGLRVTSNPYHYQAHTAGNNECGRHVVARLHYWPLSEQEYHALVQRSGLSPDEWALHVSQELLGK